MAHELTTRTNGYTEMAFVGELPWHGLGQELAQDASIEEWKVAAGFDWTIEQAPVQFATPDGAVQPVESRFVQYRSDNNYPLGIVSQRYKPVQPEQVLEFFRDLVEESGFRLHTAGTLFGGKRLWALAETGRFGEVSKGDGVGGFLLLSTSADKSLATTARFTSVRVVCNNTLSMATENNQHCVSFSHSRAFDHDLMKAKLGAAVQSFEGFMLMAQYLRKQKLEQAQAIEFVRNIVLSNEQYSDPKYNYEKNRGFAKIMSLFNEEAKGIELAGRTKWGLVNAVTEYLDHHMPARTDDARLNSAWFGTGDAMKARTLELLTA